MKLRLALAALAALAAAPAPAVEYSQLQPERSQITFVSKQMGVAVDGRFRKFAAQVNFDPAKAQAGQARIEMDMASVDTGSKEADDEVKGKGWFNIAAFPKASFVSTGVKPLGGNRYEVAGKLTIKGTTRDVVAPATFTEAGGAAQFEGQFQIKRLDYKIGEGIWSDLETVANEVQIKFRLALAPAKK